MISVPANLLDPKSPGKPSGYQPQLDGLRGIAILSVLIHHFDVHLPGWLDWGPIGVRLFFLLSGYLITLSVWKLIQQSETSGGLWKAVGGFHLKRGVRLLPVLYIMLFVGALMGLPEIREGILWHSTFLTNFYILAQDEWPGAASHLWSLSVQEQFYVLWPFLLLVVPKKNLPWALAGLVLFAFSYRFMCWHTDASVFLRWLMLPGVIDSFAMGALVACWKSAGKPFSVTHGRAQVVWAVAAVAAYVIARYLRFVPTASPWLAIIETLENFALAWLLLRTTEGWSGWFGMLLKTRWLGYIGKVSFGLYVFHVLIHVAFSPWLTQFGITDSYLRAAILIPATLVVASISWHSVEAPLTTWIRKRKKITVVPPEIVTSSAKRREAP